MGIKNKLLITLAFTVGALAMGSANAQGDAKRGAELVGNCMGCHGIPGWRNAYPPYSVPKLGGQHSQHIVAMLTAYKEKRYPHPTMQAIAGSLKPQQMQDLAAYWEGDAKVTPQEGQTAGAPQKAQVCAGCHGIDGNNTNPQFPRLAGQYPDYLAKALHDYKSGARANPIMRGFAGGLSDRDITELAHWFSSQRGLNVLPSAKP